jgi:DNA-binding beta-propeller fold protein YncE
MRFVLTVLALAIVLAVPLSAHAAPQTRAFVVTSDFTNGGLSVIQLSNHAVTPDVATVFSDARVRWFDGRVFVVNRFGQDNIQIIDPAQNYATVHQFSTGNGSNPQDIAFVSPTKAYVTRLGSPNLLEVNPAAGDTIGPISLGMFADADGLPEMDRMIRIGRYLFVQLQLLSGFVATDSSLVAVIDTEADTVVDVNPLRPGIQAIKLTGTNPVTPFVYDRARGLLLVGCAGHYGQLDGGIDQIDPFGFRDRGFAITEQALGGDVLDVVWNGPTHSYAIVSDAGFNTSLVSWSSITGHTTGTLFSPGGFSIADVERNDRGELYVCDNDLTGFPGVYIFSTDTDALLAGPLDTGLPPQGLTFDERSDEIVSAPATPWAATSFSEPWPQPARTGVRFTLALDRADDVRVEAFDVAGRLRRTLASGTMAAGVRTVSWDLRDDGGEPLAPGLYLVRVRGERIALARRVAIVR